MEKIIHNEREYIEHSRSGETGEVSFETTQTVDHGRVACQAIKVVNALKIDPFAKKVMTLRLLGPMITGRERSHMSIALELGASVDDVIQAEEYGIDAVNKALELVALPDFMEKYNRERALSAVVEGELNKNG